MQTALTILALWIAIPATPFVIRGYLRRGR